MLVLVAIKCANCNCAVFKVLVIIFSCFSKGGCICSFVRVEEKNQGNITVDSFDNIFVDGHD